MQLRSFKIRMEILFNALKFSLWRVFVKRRFLLLATFEKLDNYYFWQIWFLSNDKLGTYYLYVCVKYSVYCNHKRVLKSCQIPPQIYCAIFYPVQQFTRSFKKDVSFQNFLHSFGWKPYILEQNLSRRKKK